MPRRTATATAEPTTPVTPDVVDAPPAISPITNDGKLFYTTVDPITTLGVKVDEAKTAEEAMKLAGLDYLVEVSGVTVDATGTSAPGVYVTYRTDTGKVFGYCGSDYRPTQNFEGFDWCDNLVSDYGMRYSAAGHLKDGESVFLVADLPLDWEINGEKWKSQVMFFNSHKAGTTLRIFDLDTRLACDNMVPRLVKLGGSAAHGFKLRHTGDMSAKLAAARQVMEITTAHQRNFKAYLERATTVEVAPKLVDKVLAVLVPGSNDKDKAERPQTARAIDLFRSIHAAEVELNGTTAYSLVNATTGFVDHGLRYRANGIKDVDLATRIKAERRFDSTLEDGAGRLREKALAIISAAVK